MKVRKWMDAQRARRGAMANYVPKGQSFWRISVNSIENPVLLIHLH